MIKQNLHNKLFFSQKKWLKYNSHFSWRPFNEQATAGFIRQARRSPGNARGHYPVTTP
jgi:hypothetical protein